MAIEIKVPQFPESVEEGSIATWHKQVGEAVTRDELVVDIETDKTVLEVVATEDGIDRYSKTGRGHRPFARTDRQDRIRSYSQRLN